MPPSTAEAMTAVPTSVLHRIEGAAHRLGGPAPRRPTTARVSVDMLYDAWLAHYARHGQRLITEVARAMRLDDLGIFGFATLTAASAIDALRTAVRLYPLINPDRRWRLRDEGRELSLVLETHDEVSAGRRISDHAAVAQFLAGIGQASTHTRVREVVAGQVADDVLTALTGVEPTRGSDLSVTWERASLLAPMAHAHPGMHAHFLSLGEATIGDEPTTWSERARRILAEGTSFDAPPVANALGVSLRTLQRRLRAEGTSLLAIVDEVRYRRARQLLRDGASVESAALSLAFADARSFHRAFRRWSGQSPGAFKTSRDPEDR
ncbi:MAG: helix-turn-helix transcriptional regulator [Myxococcota bacterium]